MVNERRPKTYGIVSDVRRLAGLSDLPALPLHYTKRRPASQALFQEIPCCQWNFCR
jgi:hypothetical protein